MGIIVVAVILLPFIVGSNAVGEAIAFRKALKKQMVREIPELEQPKTKEDAVAMRQVFEEIGFFDYLEVYLNSRIVTQSVMYYLLLSAMVFGAGMQVAGATLLSVLPDTILFSLPLAALFGFIAFMAYRQARGVTRLCRSAESFSECGEEKCVSLLQSSYEVYKDYRQRYLKDQDRMRWRVVCVAAMVPLLCLIVVAYTVCRQVMERDPGPKKYREKGFQYLILEDNSAEIVRYSGRQKQVSIPDSLGGHTVSAIGAEAFMEKGKILSVELPDGITTIGNKAFYSCSNLEKVDLPEEVKSIGESAFEECESLTEIQIPDGIAEISDSVFEGCESLVEIRLPDEVRSIGNSAFAGCENLAEIQLPKEVRSIGNSAFAGCESLVEIRLPDEVRSIGDDAFEGCKSLTEVQIPDSVKECGTTVFNQCSGLQTVRLPGGMVEIPAYMFYYCEQLKSCPIPETVRLIGECSFANSGITVIELPPGIKTIGCQAFDQCKYLQSISIPDSLEEIEENPFTGCSSLENIEISADNPYVKVVDGVLFSADGARIISYPQSRTMPEYVIPEGTETIEPYAFEGCVSLEKVILPQSLTYIGNDAFHNCEKLAEINSIGKLEYLGVGAFNGCPELAEDMIPDANMNLYEYWRRNGSINY